MCSHVFYCKYYSHENCSIISSVSPQVIPNATTMFTGYAPVTVVPAPLGLVPVGRHPHQQIPPQVFVNTNQTPPAPPLNIPEEDIEQLRDMFPSIDVDVIRTILENNRGNKDRAINNLLQMN